MTLNDWLRGRAPVAPAELAARIEALAAPFEDLGGGRPAQCLAAAERGLVLLLAKGTGHRGSALDLLAVDALVTYAFEAACEDPAGIPDLAHEAMGRLAAVGGLA